jgi:chromosome segregation ATPase
MNIELKKNAEGYTDTTAAATLLKKEPGDTWTYKGGSCLVLQSHAGFATILKIHDNNQYGDRVRVPGGYVDPAFLITGRYSEMGEYTGTLEPDDFQRVMDAVQDSLGIKSSGLQEQMQFLDGIEAQVQEIQEDRTKLMKENEFLRCQLAEMTELHARAVERVNKVNFAKLKVENQLELLQSMVGSVLARFQVDTEG